jgi:hypothetical protein
MPRLSLSPLPQLPFGVLGGPFRAVRRRRAPDASGVAPDTALLCAAVQGRDPAGGQGGDTQAVQGAVTLPGVICVRLGRRVFWARRSHTTRCDMCAVGKEGVLGKAQSHYQV